MLSQEYLQELRSAWLPNITDAGLDRLIELLETSSPLLIHGSFVSAVPMGCLATHAAWHHPVTADRTADAGITWLALVACLNPATSEVIKAWDGRGRIDLEFRANLLGVFREERDRRHTPAPCPEVLVEV